MADPLNFHMTFPPTPAYLGRILKIANGTEYTVEEISDLTGIPQGKSSGKVKPHIAYASYMGLIDESMFKRTALGDAVMQEDSVLAETLTQAICHTRITSCVGASMWNYLFRVLLPENNYKIKKKMISEKMQHKFGINVKFAPVITMYTKQFTNLNILTEEEEYLVCNALPFDNDLLYVYAYGLLFEWEKVFPQEKEITSVQLSDLKFGAIYGWSQEVEYKVLQLLCDIGVIGMNNQLIPFTVKKYVDSETVIDKLYSLLF